MPKKSPLDLKILVLTGILAFSALLFMLLSKPQKSELPNAITSSVVKEQFVTQALQSEVLSSILEIRPIGSARFSVGEVHKLNVFTNGQFQGLARSIFLESEGMDGKRNKAVVSDAEFEIEDTDASGELVVGAKDWISIQPSKLSPLLSQGIYIQRVFYVVSEARSANQTHEMIDISPLHALSQSLSNISIIFYPPKEVPETSIRFQFMIGRNAFSAIDVLDDSEFETTIETTTTPRIVIRIRPHISQGETLRINIAWPKPELFNFEDNEEPQ